MLDSITVVPSWFVSDLVGTVTTMLNIATAHANMVSLFIIRFWIVSQMFLNLNFKTSSNMQMLYSLVCHVEDK